MPEIDEQFEWDDFHRDTRELSLDAKGAWWDCLYKMRLSPTRGRISMPLSSYAIMFGASQQKAKKVIDEIAERQVGDFCAEANGNVTLINRRMFREWQAREADKIRQRKHRGQPDPFLDPARHETVTNGHKNASYVEESINVKEKKKQKRVATTRIPDPFPLLPAMIEWASVNCPGLHTEAAHENFIEYYTNNATVKAEKIDWMMTWRKGMKLALKWQKENEARASIGKAGPGKADPLDAEIVTDSRCGFCGADYCLKDHHQELLDQEQKAA